MKNIHRTLSAVARHLGLLLLLLCPALSQAQHLPQLADSFRRAYSIPELGFAVVKADTVVAMHLCGYHRSDRTTTADTASLSDYFHLGSNTKAITGLIAGWLVESGRIQWQSKFFDLFPAWKDSCKPVYHNITLADLLSHRARIQPFTGGEEFMWLPNFKGKKPLRRERFVKYLLTQEPVPADNAAWHYSNAGYSVAALMLEKASGRSWEDLVGEVLGEKLGLRFAFGWPSRRDSTGQPWGHWLEGETLRPVPPATDYNLKLVEPAGDLSMPLADYAKLVQLHVQGLSGQDNFLKAATYRYLHTGFLGYAIGWLNVNEGERQLSVHAGSDGTFYCYTVINRKQNLAYVVIANSGAPSAQQGVAGLAKRLMAVYGRNPSGK